MKLTSRKEEDVDMIGTQYIMEDGEAVEVTKVQIRLGWLSHGGARLGEEIVD